MTDLLSRRAALGVLAAAGAAGTGGMLPTMAAARAPLAKSQPAYFYRFPLGEFQATVVSDRPLGLGKPADTMKGVAEADLTKALADNFLPTDSIVLEQNILVLNTGARLAMFDSGLGTSTMFGTTTGRLIKSLREAGINPSDIDDIIITHAHIDHIGGLVDAKGQLLFPNATVHLSKVDFDFWTDEKKVADKALGAFVKHARDNLLPYRERIKFVTDGKEVISGVTAVSTPGHTIGHTMYLIQSAGKTMAFTGDITHHQVLLTEKPRIEFAYDSDPKAAVETRLKVFDMLAKDRIPLLAFHFPWPGYGFLGRQSAESYRYFAQPMTLVPIPAKKG